LKYVIRFSTLVIFWSDWINLSKMDKDGSKWIKMDQNESNLIKLVFWWNNHWNISSDFQLYLFFDQIESDLSKRDQNGSNLIKLDFWWNNHWNISSDFQLYLFFDQIEPDLSKMDQNGSKWIKTDQTWSNWISDEIIIDIYHQIFNFIYLLIRLNQICPI
jgi:hypothetical protein